MAQLFTPPFQTTLDANANAVSGAQLFFYVSGTSTPAPVYADAALAVSLGSVVEADAAGRFVPIYLDPAVTYRVVVTDASAAVIRDVDPVNSTDNIAADLADGGGANFIGFSHTATAQAGTLANHIRRAVYVTDAPFNARGDGTTDDSDAIQAAIDYVESQGGGEVLLSITLGGRYRITKGLKLPSYVGLVGVGVSRYPFNAGNANSSSLVADFANPNQWVIEPKSIVGTSPVPYNELVTGGLPTQTCYNCSVRNLVITSINTMPFGGIRMHGSPGSVVDNVAITGVGCGLLVNYCFGGYYSVHTLTPYYGVLAWEDTNANVFEPYAAQAQVSGSYPTTVPTAYQMPFIASLASSLVASHRFATADHATRPIGLAVGATNSSSPNNAFDATIERFPTGLFMLYAYGTAFRRLYTEGGVNQMKVSVAASRSSFDIQALHAFLSGTGAVFDLGLGINASVAPTGTIFAGGYGTGPFVDSPSTSRMVFRTIAPGQMVGAPIQTNISYPDAPSAWTAPTWQNSWANRGDPANDAGYRLHHGRTEFQGQATGGVSGTVAFTLPAGFRPYKLVVIGSVTIEPSGAVTLNASGPVSLEGVSFEAGQ